MKRNPNAQPPLSAWSIALSFVLYGGIMGLCYGAIMSSLAVGLATGALAGALFTGILTLFTVLMSNKMERDMPADALYAGPANHRVGRLKTDGGYLMLTPEVLLFRAHGVNLHPNSRLEIPLRSITDCHASVRWLIVRTDSSQERFVVSQKARWVERIVAAHDAWQRASLPGGPSEQQRVAG